MTKHWKKLLVFFSIVIIILSLSALAILPNITLPETTIEEQPLDTSIKVAVLNGCGREGLAAVFSEKLRSLGFDVVNGLGENADSFDYEESLVLDRRGVRVRAEKVANALKINAVLEQRTDDPYLIEDVVIIIGRDWDTLNISKEDFVD